MNFELTDEQKHIRHTVRKFVEDELIPLEQQLLSNEREGREGISRQQLKALQIKARGLGLWGIETPEQYGGANLGTVTSAIVKMELGRTCVPFVLGGEADNILFMCNEKQMERYLYPVISGDRQSCFALTERSAGSDANNIQMSAKRTVGGWILNGEKVFITNGNEADFAIVFAVTNSVPGKNKGITCFLVDREMGWTSEPIPTMGGDKSPSLLTFDRVLVPDENVLGEVDQGLAMAMQWISRGRWVIPAIAVGASERLLKMAIVYANERVTFGEALASRQSIQWMIADSAVEIEALKWLVLYTAWRVEQQLDARHHASMSKLYGAGVANQVVDRVLQIFGGMGYSKDLPIERWYREMRVWRIYEGTDEIQRLIISRNLLKGNIRVGEWD
ncbi:acyl-CoA dehydrogenase family protein [Paenibacillus lentus]|uniref:Medium-chain specific acyl-CoA dehydrogenase, mitochondrial n=1 Tax=Paenibacillus lentus TaxID=1338368 RepID=A0A3S8RWQ5_9BACL|nr:acyl-CoA dehydrogenase family protein [Paenibacillus lentus]AZK47456.1 acyl-CoA dehydrogenase [Paenibacillus lentus]